MRVKIGTPRLMRINLIIVICTYVEMTMPVLARIVSAILAVVVLVACGDLCGNRTLEEISDPSGTHRAIVFIRDCGATTGFSVQVSLVTNGEKLPNEGGNVLILDDASGWAPDGAPDCPLKLTWISEHELEVSVKSEHAIVRLAETYDDIRISKVPWTKTTDN